ncbi:UNVERIFIED_CONTAM: hypothetical protein FKN15_054777 [Acipenser sinensis]
MDRNALAELLQALESRHDAEERRREERYTALIEQMVALASGWHPLKKAGQLAAALQVLLDLGAEELTDYQAIFTALERCYGGVEPAVALCQTLATRFRQPGEDLATEAFIQSLTPDALRQEVRIAAPTSLELALVDAQRIEAMLEQGKWVQAPKGKKKPSLPQVHARQTRGPEGAEDNVTPA